MAGIGDALGGKGGGAVQQLFLWQVVGQLVSILASPAFNELSRAVNRAAPTAPLTPADLADMVVRNIVDHQTAQIYASESGITGADFDRMVGAAGDAPSPQELIAALRRGVIPHDGTGPQSTSFVQGIAEGRLKNKWTPMIEALANVPIGVADAVDAVVESQIPHDVGAHFAFLNGVSADDFQILVNTRGNPPSPTQLVTLYKRGLIPLEGTGPDALSVQQGIFEGATKNKWWELTAKLGDYVPPPRTIVAMVKNGSLEDDAALKYLKQNGLDDTLAAAMLADAHHQKTQVQRDLTDSQIAALYKDRLIDKAEAAALWGALRYSDADIAFKIDLADFEVEQARVRTAVSKIHSLYVAHKIDVQQATTALDGLHIPASGRDAQLSVWNQERDANVPTLTRAEIVDAWFYSIIDDATADQMLEALGWTADEAAILRGIRAHGKQRPAPTQ